MTQETQKTTLTRTLVGKVVSNKMQKTVTVLVERKVKHPLYGKFVLVSKKYHAHCESNDLTEGDTVEISETSHLQDEGLDGDEGYQEGRNHLIKLALQVF